MTAVAVCTGGASGIGRATAVALGRRGASVMVGDVDEVGGEMTTRLVREAGGEAEFLRTDIADPGEVEALVGAAVERFGDSTATRTSPEPTRASGR
jgi:NAD(P)-dependent dehydrogenase (short-subunit alcohol dehydrogenase family)